MCVVNVTKLGAMGSVQHKYIKHEYVELVCMYACIYGCMYMCVYILPPFYPNLKE